MDLDEEWEKKQEEKIKREAMSGWDKYFNLIAAGHHVDEQQTLLLIGQFRKPNGDFRDIEDAPFPPADGTEDYSKFYDPTLSCNKSSEPDRIFFSDSEESEISSSSDDSDYDSDFCNIANYNPDRKKKSRFDMNKDTKTDSDDDSRNTISIYSSESSEEENLNDNNENITDDATSVKCGKKKKFDGFSKRMLKMVSKIFLTLYI